MFLESLRRKREYERPAEFPWTLPVVQSLEEAVFKTPVTFFVGENGCGKSTVMEGIAAGIDAVAVGARDLYSDHTLAAAREFARGFRFSRKERPHTKMFLRAEDVFGFTQRVEQSMRELKQFEDEFAQSLPEGEGRGRAMGAMRGQRRQLTDSYGERPDARSHGETFLHLLDRRLIPGGLYLLDEPETPLSPARILSLLSILIDGVNGGSQFIIATHSPILMALPGATIYAFEEGRIVKKAYDEVEHVRITKDFLAAPERYLRWL